MNNIRFISARLKASHHMVKTPYVIKKETGHKIKDWIFNKAWDIFNKWGNIEPHFDVVDTETFDFTESKKTLISDRILEEIHKRQKYHNDRVHPSTHVIVMGENTFFEIINDKNQNSPFFGKDITIMSNDFYYYDPYHGRRSFGFSCHVIKGMQGFAIIPKVMIETK